VTDIKAELVNYSMMYIDCDRGIAQELSEYFSFYVPGYKFMPAYRNKVWDGKIRLFNHMTYEISAGLAHHVKKFAAECNYSIEFLSNPRYGSPLDTNTVPTFQTWLDSMVQTSLPFPPRNYQEEALKVGLKSKRAILLSPTGSGKSFIIYLLMKYYMELINTDKKILIIVPTTSLVEQMYSDFSDYNMDVEKYCHKIYSGKDKNTSKRVVISTWQSIYKHPKSWFTQFGMVVGDECHGFKSKSLSSIMNKATEAEYRFGTTGTLDGTQTHRLVLEGLFGPVYKVITTKALQDNDTLAPLDIKVLLLSYSEEVRKNFGKKTYQQEIDFIIGHPARNRLICNLSLDAKGNTLVLYSRVDAHGKPLYEMINSKAEEGRKVFFVSGDVDTSDREAIRQIVEKQNNAIIVASLGTFSTGINIRNLHNIIFASPSKSQIKVLQSIGRGLRKSDNGRETKLFDVADDLHWKAQQNYTLLHSAERTKIYEKEQFKYKVIKVDIV
jgi:superfamily II DNA or RNA helicase